MSMKTKNTQKTPAANKRFGAMAALTPRTMKREDER